MRAVVEWAAGVAVANQTEAIAVGVVGAGMVVVGGARLLWPRRRRRVVPAQERVDAVYAAGVAKVGDRR